MNDLILHNYASSPFSEKIRLILGHKKLPWKSVLVPPILPKPDVLAEEIADDLEAALEQFTAIAGKLKNRA